LRKFSFEKIVRSKIPDIIREKGGIVESRSLTDTEVFVFLGQKAIEEIIEVQEATVEHRSEEFADLLEVSKALVSASEVPQTEISHIRRSEPSYSFGFAELGQQALESVKELASALPDDRALEMAHFLGVVDAWIDVSGVSRTQIEQIRDDKRREFGGFSPAIYIETVSVPNDDTWADDYVKRGYQEIHG